MRVVVVSMEGVVTRGRIPSEIMLSSLDNRLGSRGDGAPALSHYRAIYVSKNDLVKVFTLVPGAEITGTVEPNVSVKLVHREKLQFKDFVYRKQVESNSTGFFEAKVPYAGNYQVKAGNWSESVSVSEGQVKNGSNIVLR